MAAADDLAALRVEIARISADLDIDDWQQRSQPCTDRSLALLGNDYCKRLLAYVDHLRDLLNRTYRLQKMHTEGLERHLKAAGVPTRMPKREEKR